MNSPASDEEDIYGNDSFDEAISDDSDLEDKEEIPEDLEQTEELQQIVSNCVRSLKKRCLIIFKL